MSGRAAKQPISYAEVDSDVDLSSGDDELMRSLKGDNSPAAPHRDAVADQRGKGDTYGAHKPAKKKARLSKEKESKAKQSKEPSLDLDLLLALPFDALSEICSHLQLGDLVQLASTSRALRQLLLSPSAGRQLWARVRRESGYVVPDGMDDISFALLLEGKNCQDCGASKSTTTLRHLRVRLCRLCKKERIIKRRDVPKDMPHVHKAAASCVRSEPDYHEREDHAYCFKTDLQEIDERLQELEEDDERARAENERLCWTTKSRRGRLGSKKDLADAGNVQRFVDAQQAVFAEEQAQMNAARKVKQALIEQRTAEKAEIERKKRDEFEAALVEHHGWTEEQVNAHSRRFGWRHQPPAQCPRAQPHVKPDAWRAYRDALQVVLDNDAAERRAAPGRALRIHFFRDKFNLIDGTDPRFKGIFPSFDRFRKLDPIKALWYPEDAQLDGSTWPTQEPLVLQVLEELADSTRVNAIRAILAANSGEALSTLSTDPADYPDDEYDDAFFQQITSHFVVGRWTLVPRGRRLRRTIVNTPTAFPTVLGHMWGTWYSNHGADPFASKLTPRYVSALRLILDAAELDEDATPSTLDNLGPTFSVARQGKTIATGKTWMQTVELLRKVGGTDKELGAGIDVSVTHEDAKGKEKGAVSDLEGEGEGESEDGADGSE